MKRKNTTRNALFTSVISLLLCVSMLVGTTFAWFTDSVASANNIIKSGNLDIELEYWDGDSWENVAGKSDILTNTLWEPGVTEIAYLRVANAGSLALKYQLGINIVSETAGVNQAGKEFKLSDYIQFGVVESETFATYATREAAVADLTGAKKLNAGYTKASSMTADQELYLALVVYMPTTVGNEANHNGEDVPSIELGINVLATQLENESDSFGDDYDEDAWVDGFDVYTEQDLNAAIANGETAIDLMGDIAVGEQILIPEGAKVKLNLNGKTLSSATGTVIRNEGALTLVGKGTVESAGQAYAIRVQQGTMIIDSADINVKGAFGAVSIFNGADVTINGGNFNAEGINGMTSHTVYVSKSTLTVNGGTFDSGYSSEGIDTICGSNSTITLNDGTFYASELGESFFLKNVTSVKGGTYQYKPANIAAGYKVIENNGKYVVVSENVDGVVTTAAGLADAIAQGRVVSVMADIDMNNAWTSVVPANGLVIEGNDHVISNLNLPLMAGKGGPTVTVKGLTIADSNVGIAANEKGLGTGAFIAFADYSGTLVFEDCHLVNSTVTGNERAAAFVGYSYAGVTIRDCSVDKCTITAVGSTAALIGHANGVTTIEKTSVTNTKVTATEDRTGSTAVAGSLIGTVANTTALNKVTSSNNTVSNTGATPYSAEFGRIVSAGKLIVDGAELKTASTQAALDAAVSSTGNVEITLTNGEYKMPSSGTTGEVTITGTKDTVLDMTMGAYMESANVTIDGVTIKTSTGMVNGNGADYAALYTPNVTYKDCTFVGPLRVGRDGAKFINCTFTELGNDYVWTYGNDVTFEGCTFNTDGKAILIYSDGGNEVAQVSVKNCVFNSTKGAKAGAIANQNCAAIEIHNYGNGVNLVTEGNTYDSNFSGEWRIKTYETDRTQIFVNGTEYTTIAIDGKIMTIDANKNVTVQ